MRKKPSSTYELSYAGLEDLPRCRILRKYSQLKLYPPSVFTVGSLFVVQKLNSQQFFARVTLSGFINLR